jgi:hypothetical protein
MRQLFAVPWLSSGGRIALSILCVATLVCGVLGLLKVSIGEKQAPNKELTTGSIHAKVDEEHNGRAIAHSLA